MCTSEFLHQSARALAEELCRRGHRAHYKAAPRCYPAVLVGKDRGHEGGSNCAIIFRPEEVIYLPHLSVPGVAENLSYQEPGLLDSIFRLVARGRAYE